MISSDKLLQLRSKVKRGQLLDRDQQLAVIDHGIQALVEIAGGQSILDKRNELKTREAEVAKALVDLRVQIAEIQVNIPVDVEPAVVEGQVLVDDLSKAIYTVDAITEMLKAKGPAWKREWSWYRPRIEEEFSP